MTISDAHFLRPLWLLALIPLIFMGLSLWRKTQRLKAWDAICDPHLLAHLLQNQGGKTHRLLLVSLLGSGFFFIISLSGPVWERLPVPAFQSVEPRIIVLDLTNDMLEDDLLPNRLSRAKFKLTDLFQEKNPGQWGMVVYTGDSFVVSPLTEDAQTISALLPSLAPDIMPVSGNRLDLALKQAAGLITDAGFHFGQILVLTPTSPSSQAIATAKTLEKKRIHISVMPIGKNGYSNDAFERFAKAGGGLLINLTVDSSDLSQWLKANHRSREFIMSQYNDVPLWQDEGRWFLIPALLFFLPLFRRGNLQGIMA